MGLRNTLLRRTVDPDASYETGQQQKPYRDRHRALRQILGCLCGTFRLQPGRRDRSARLKRFFQANQPDSSTVALTRASPIVLYKGRL